MKLFGHKKQAATTATMPQVECPHAVLVARWDSVEDMGKEDKATRFMCEACHEMFSPDEAREIRAGVAHKLVGQQEAVRSNTEEIPDPASPKA